jgi:hypothetical protein
MRRIFRAPAAFLDEEQAQRKPEIQPDRIRDDLLRETVALVADRRTLACVSMPNSLTLRLCDSTFKLREMPKYMRVVDRQHTISALQKYHGVSCAMQHQPQCDSLPLSRLPASSAACCPLSSVVECKRRPCAIYPWRDLVSIILPPMKPAACGVTGPSAAVTPQAECRAQRPSLIGRVGKATSQHLPDS